MSTFNSMTSILSVGSPKTGIATLLKNAGSNLYSPACQERILRLPRRFAPRNDKVGPVNCDPVIKRGKQSSKSARIVTALRPSYDMSTKVTEQFDRCMKKSLAISPLV